MINQVIKLREGRDDVTLTTYINTQSEDFLKDVKRPALLICPGGAYMTCADGEGEPVAMRFSAMGYQTFVLRYSTYMEGKPGIPDPSKPMPANEKSIFPNGMIDIKTAMETIAEHADEWHVNTDQITLCGFSAGAHNCGMYSVYCTEMNMPKPAAAILGYTLGDYRMFLESDMDKMAEKMFEMSCIAIAGTSKLSEETLHKLSVIENIDQNTPPMFLWATSEDEQIPVVQSLRIAQELSVHGVPFEIHIFEKGHHGLSVGTYASAIVQEQVRPDIAVWADMADRWLKSRVSITLPEKMPF